MMGAMAVVVMLGLACASAGGGATINRPAGGEPSAEGRLMALLDAPLLFVKRHSYTGIHIYDTYYKWPPGGGGIYVLENPSAPRSRWKIRPVIDPATFETLGEGVYTHPELSWDARRLLFCFKPTPQGSTSIYEIGVDGRGLRRVTNPEPLCDCHKGSGGGLHDIAPAYLPDGRIVFLSTRPSGLVPCANSGVSILHVMNADGSDIHPISVNNVHEFDPCVLPDGRLLFGRWEYVDKNALTIQSLWTMNPDGTQETALYANNMVFPEALLDARPVPGTRLIVATLAKHNSTPRGSIGLLDPLKGKNDPAALVNLEHPDDPTYDRGDSCEPWPVTADVFLLSGRPKGEKRNRLEIMDLAGHRFTVLADPQICLHSPMLVKPRPRPLALADTVDRKARSGRFFLQDVYRGLSGVKRGEVKWLRVVEETSRVSATPGGKQPYNQTFLVSAALAFSVKNYLGVVPVAADGSAYFEVPSGRAVYFQALDGEGRLVHSMRTFVKAAPGTTRSCIGCHEYKYAATTPTAAFPSLLGREPSRLQDESWGSGYVDYPSMVQPVLDRRCVRCHGGKEGIAGRMDLTGGWTEHFSISYENLANRCETQLVAYWITGIDCMNGTALWSSKLFAPRSHGSGAAPLAQLLVSGHGGRIPELTRRERDLLMAWIDSNGLYHGTWDYTKHGCAIASWKETQQAVLDAMQKAGCRECHAAVENDWINLERPELSRLLRAPTAKSADGLGLALCRQRKVDPKRPRVRLLWNGYAHAVQPPEKFPSEPRIRPNDDGQPVVSLTSTADPKYQALLKVIREGRRKALAAPRADMPGADVLAGECRQFLPPELPRVAPSLAVAVDAEGSVHLAWERSARTIGLTAELHRSSQAGFTPSPATLQAESSRSEFIDSTAPAGRQHYALVYVSGNERSQPSRAAVDVPPPSAPPAASGLKAVGNSYCVRLEWEPAGEQPSLGYHVYRGQPGAGQLQRVTEEPIRETSFSDLTSEIGVPFAYAVRSVSGRGVEGPLSNRVTAAATVTREPVFTVRFDRNVEGRFLSGESIAGTRLKGARIEQGMLDVCRGGAVSFAHRPEFGLGQPLSVECWVWFERQGKMPVVVSCGQWRSAGWFLQWIGTRWRWHVGGVDCDGGRPEMGRWIHVVGIYDGRRLRLFQDGQPVAEAHGLVSRNAFPGPLYLGQYSGSPGPDFQVAGRIAGVKLYHRPLEPTEIAAAAKTPPVK
jgi:hypothetical protein